MLILAVLGTTNFTECILLNYNFGFTIPYWKTKKCTKNFVLRPALTKFIASQTIENFYSHIITFNFMYRRKFFIKILNILNN